MITMISLANVHHHTWLNSFFFLVMMTFKISPLRKFQICNKRLHALQFLIFEMNDFIMLMFTISYELIAKEDLSTPVFLIVKFIKI